MALLLTRQARPSPCASPRFRINSCERAIGAPWAKQLRLWSFGSESNALRPLNSLRELRLAPRVGFEPTACRLTAERIENLSALSGVAYEKLGAIFPFLVAPTPVPTPAAERNTPSAMGNSSLLARELASAMLRRWDQHQRPICNENALTADDGLSICSPCPTAWIPSPHKKHFNKSCHVPNP
jgi:hypothetical protein